MVVNWSMEYGVLNVELLEAEELNGGLLNLGGYIYYVLIL